MARTFAPVLRSSYPPDSSGNLTAAQVDANMTGIAEVANAAIYNWHVASQAAMLALSTAIVGDLATRTDNSQVFMLMALPASTLSNWQQMEAAASAVLSVAGRTGAVVLGAVDSSFTQSGTGAAASTVDAKLKLLEVNVSDFGATGNGTTDDTTAIQNAINAVLPVGGIVRFNSGTYKVTATLNLINNANNAAPGMYIRGASGTGGTTAPGSKTKIMSYIANGPLFNVQGTKTQASGGSGSLFMNGGGIYDLYLDGTNATGTSQGLKVLGWQYAEMVNCTVANFPGDGLTQVIDAGYATADYSSSSLNITNTWFWNNAGIGVNQTGVIGAWSWTFYKCLFGYNGTGLTITSAGNSLRDCSFVGSGFTAGGAVIGAGIHLKVGSSTASTNRLTIHGCEFDFARVSHITLDYCVTVSISQTRLIFNDRNSTGSMTPPIGINIASAGAGSNVSYLGIDKINFRVDTVGTMTLVNLANFSNVANISITNPALSDNTGGASTITKYAGFYANNYNLRANYFIDDRTNRLIIPGTPAPEYVGTCSSSTVPNAANVIFGTQETTNSQIFGSNLYNTTTGVWTCPSQGYYDVDFSISVVSTLTSEYYQFQLIQNSTAVTEFDYAGNGQSRCLMRGRWRIFCNAGDILSLKSTGANGKSITGSYSQLVIKQVL